jgi:predicted nucleic acid-binding protein
MIIDTMVFAYALLGVEDLCEQAIKALAAAEVIEVPDSLRAELVNVIWKWIYIKDVSLDTGIKVLEDAEALIDRVIPCDQLWERALELSVLNKHPAYDTLFIAAAELARTRLLTFDKKLIRLFPELTVDAVN